MKDQQVIEPCSGQVHPARKRNRAALHVEVRADLDLAGESPIGGGRRRGRAGRGGTETDLDTVDIKVTRDRTSTRKEVGIGGEAGYGGGSRAAPSTYSQ